MVCVLLWVISAAAATCVLVDAQQATDAATPKLRGSGVARMPIPMSRSVSGVETKCWWGLQTVGEFTACLASVPLDVETRDCTLQIVGEQLTSLYTYSSLVRNSTDNDAELPPGFDFEVYNLTLGPYIDELWPQLQAETSAGLFALRLSDLFAKFQDAHTKIYFQFLVRTNFLPPVVVAVDLDEAKDMRFRVVNRRIWSPAGMMNKTISTINGMPALDYYLSVAELEAFDKSRGAQLNRFLQKQYVRGALPPSDGAFNVTFIDGSMEQLSWMVAVNPNACHLGEDFRLCNKTEVMSGRCPQSTQVMKQCFSHNKDFDSLATTMAKLGRPLPCTTRAAQAEAEVADGVGDRVPTSPFLAAVPGLAVETHAIDVEEEEEEMEEEVAMELADEFPVGETFLASTSEIDEVNGAGHELLSVQYDGHSCQALKVPLADNRHAAVLKISSFKKFSVIKPCAEAAVALAAEVSDGHLIVDVISNGGGSVNTGYELNQYLYEKMPGSQFKDPLDSCEWYDLPTNPELSWLVDLSQRRLPGLDEVPDPREHIIGLAERMREVVHSLQDAPSYFGQTRKVWALRSAAECLEMLVVKFATPTIPLRSEEGGDDSAWQLFNSLYGQCVGAAKPFGGHKGLQIIDYRKSNEYPNPLSPPSWDYYRNPVTKIRGGMPRNFSSLTFLGVACQAYRALYPETYGPKVLREGGWPVKPQQKLRHLTYLSDGLCGSTCSVSSTQPYLEGLSTFVTFGGVKGETMDITSFNGGNIGTYQGGRHPLWKHALGPAVDASILFPDAEPRTWPFAPIPMNLLRLTFAQRAEYPRALGSKALPREWYKIPASYHLDVWTSHSLHSLGHMSVLAKQQLHELYAVAADLKPKPLVRTP